MSPLDSDISGLQQTDDIENLIGIEFVAFDLKDLRIFRETKLENNFTWTPHDRTLKALASHGEIQLTGNLEQVSSINRYLKNYDKAQEYLGIFGLRCQFQPMLHECDSALGIEFRHFERVDYLKMLRC
jgi:hypothetical protein